MSERCRSVLRIACLLVVVAFAVEEVVAADVSATGHGVFAAQDARAAHASPT
jgi:hypothetical protein